MRALEQFVVTAGQLAQLDEVTRGQQFQIFVDNQHRQRAVGTIVGRPQLEQQALLKVARPDADRIEILDVAQGDFQFLDLDFVLWRQRFPEFRQRSGEVAVVVQCLDQETDQAAVTLAQLGHSQLPAQMLTQADIGGMNIVAVAIVILVAPGTGESARIRRPAIVIDFRG